MKACTRLGCPNSSAPLKFTFDGKELASVSKKWAGVGKELFTSADNYILRESRIPGPDDLRYFRLDGAVTQAGTSAFRIEKE